MRTLATFALGIIVMTTSSLGCQEEQASIDLAPSRGADGGAPADAGRAVDGSMQRLDAAVPKDNQPYIVAAGIGVTDLEVSAEFYQGVLGLEFQYELSTPSWKEKVLSDVRGSNVVLMDYVRERNTKKNPVKLVFAVKNLAQAYDAVLAGGGTSVAAPAKFGETNVALTYDPDQYLVELIEVPSVPSNVLVGMGIGVSSLDDSADFYTRVVGLQFRRDIDVPGFMDEKELGSYQMKGPALVLMHYEDESRTYKDIPAKVVFGVSDASRFASAIEREDESKIVAAPMVYGDSGLRVGMAKDLEGYLVEFLQSTRSAP